jgi:hypothetical protein
VVFLYVSSLAFNLKFQFNAPLLSILVPILLIIEFHLGLLPKSFLTSSPSKLFFGPSSGLMLFLINYLLVVLFFAVKLTKSLKGAVAQKF